MSVPASWSNTIWPSITSSTIKLARRLQAAIQVDGRDDRFQRVHQQRLLAAAAAHLLAAAQFQVAAQFQAPRHAMQMRGAHQARLQHRKLAFLGQRKAAEQYVAHHQPQDGIAQEFQLLVVDQAAPAPFRVSQASELWVSARRSNSWLVNRYFSFNSRIAGSARM